MVTKQTPGFLLEKNIYGLHLNGRSTGVVTGGHIYFAKHMAGFGRSDPDLVYNNLLLPNA